MTRQNYLIVLLALLSLLGLAACGSTDLQVSEPWARTGSVGENTGVFMVIKNKTAQDLRLLSAASEAAGAVELHLSMMVDGAMQMVEQESIVIPAGGETVLKPRDYHVMLIGLRQDLKIGDSFELRLFFDNGSEVLLKVPVKGE